MNICLATGRRYPQPIVSEGAGQVTHSGHPLFLAIDTAHQNIRIATDIRERVKKRLPELRDEAIRTANLINWLRSVPIHVLVERLFYNAGDLIRRRVIHALPVIPDDRLVPLIYGLAVSHVGPLALV